MIQALSGDRSGEHLKASIGKTIKSVKLEESTLRIEFRDGTYLSAHDEGQSCCETRYMRTDDDLDKFTGATLTGIRIRTADNVKHEYEEHEVQFLDVETSLGVFTMSNHNEHNGYYGGFAVQLSSGRVGPNRWWEATR